MSAEATKASAEAARASANAARVAANSVRIERDAYRSAIEGLRKARSSMMNNAGLSAEERSEALAAIDESLQEIQHDMDKAGTDN